MFDDLFSDEPAPELTQDELDDIEVQKHNERIQAVLDRNMAVMEAAQDHLEKVQALQGAIFGGSQAADEFSDRVEKRIQQDDDFKEKFELMSSVHSETIHQLQLEQQCYEPVPRQRPINPQLKAHNEQTASSSSVYIPGNPINAPAKSATSKRNHILRKNMI